MKTISRDPDPRRIDRPKSVVGLEWKIGVFRRSIRALQPELEASVS